MSTKSSKIFCSALTNQFPTGTKVYAVSESEQIELPTSLYGKMQKFTKNFRKMVNTRSQIVTQKATSEENNLNLKLKLT